MNSIRLKEYYKKYSNIIHIILWIIFICWKIPFLNKGIDYTDTGFSMENYKNVFYGAGINDIGLVLTNFIGGVIYKILPAYHLLVYRVLHWLISLSTAFFAYQIFKKYLDKNLILVILLGLAIVSKGGEALFSYYPMTSCILMLSLLLLHNGLVEKKNIKIFWSGLVAGINVLFRLTNVLYFALFLVVIFWGWVKGYKKKEIIKQTCIYVLGIMVSFAIMIPVLFLVIGKDSIISSSMSYVYEVLGLKDTSVTNTLGIEEQSGHSLLSEIRTISIQSWKAIKTFIMYILPVSLLGVCLNVFMKKSIKLKHSSVVLFVCFVLISIFVSNRIDDTIFFVLGVGSMLISFILLIKLHKKNCEFEILFFITLISGCCSVFGSDGGLSRLSIISNFMLLTFYIGIRSFISSYEEENNNSIMKTTITMTKYIFVFIMICCYSSGIMCKLPVTYNDADYSELIHTVNPEIKVLKGMKTSKTRANQINEYYTLMSRDELQNYEIAMFGFFPLAFNISDQTDYFESVMPCIDYPRVSVERLLIAINEKQEDNIKPLIVVSYVNQLQRGNDHFTSDAKEAVLEYMLEQYEYETYYESKNFLVYRPVE